MTGAMHTAVVRPAAVAGRFYPASARLLAGQVDRFLAAVDPYRAATVRAAIVPHAGYPCSGQVAAHVFKALQALPERDRLVYLLGPAHWLPVAGVALPTWHSFATPLGEVAVDQAAVQALIDQSDLFCRDDSAHGPEHCLEVELPFMQRVLPGCRIVPGLAGGDLDPRALAAVLAPMVSANRNRLVIVSSDLSHYHSYARAHSMDMAFLQAVERGDTERVAGGEACGLPLIRALTYLAERLNWRAHLLHYSNSGDSCGSRSEVVGYGAVLFTA